MEESYEIVRTVKALEAKITQSKEHCNDIIKLLKYCQSSDNIAVFSATKALHRIFTKYIEAGDLQHISPSDSEKNKKLELNPKSQLGQWLFDQYSTFIQILKTLLHREDSAVQISALNTLLGFEQKFGATISAIKQTSYFTNLIFPSVIKNLVINQNLNAQLVTAFNNTYLQPYNDICLYTLKNMRNVIIKFLSKSKSDSDKTIFCENVYLILNSVNMPSEEQAITQFFVEPSAATESKEENQETKEHVGKKRKFNELSHSSEEPSKVRIRAQYEYKNAFQNCWLEFLKADLPNQIYKLVLGSVHEKIIPHLLNPIILMDWLTDSSNVGGEIAILALHGLFILITKHNLDYPDFYQKLYKLFESSIFSVEYASRFFKLSEIFLKSPLLPTYLVAAFIKKMCRLCLIAPPTVTMIMLPLIYNLMICHPTTQVLIHKQHKTGDNTLLQLDVDNIAAEDPFDPNETDIKKCNAIKSSLWELKVLMNDNIPAVASVAKIFKNKVSKRVEYNLQDFFSKSYNSLFEEEMNRKVKKGVPLAFQEPNTFFSTVNFPGWNFQR